MKPALFNTEMVRAILDGRKTETRRVVKGYALEHLELDVDGSIIGVYDQFEGRVFPIMNYAPYRPGDILYVRETWAVWNGNYEYKADVADGYGPFCTSCIEDVCTGNCNSVLKWCPSIHMPREAARIFLRVKDVGVERVQDITDEEARREWCANWRDFRRVWNDCYSKPRPVKGKDGTIHHYESYPWEDVREARMYLGKPWLIIGNPWVWVIEFERITKEVAE